MAAAPKQPAPELPLPKNPQELENVLAMFQAPDTQKIKQAEQILKAFMRKKECVPGFIQQIVQSQHWQARQMSTVLLRECIWSHWRKLAADSQNQVKKSLIQQLMKENNRAVRLSLCGLISAIGKYLVPNEKWPEIVELMIQCSKSNEPAQREVALLLYRTLAEYVGEALKPQYGSLVPLLANAMKDPVDLLRLEGLKGLVLMTETITEKKEVGPYRDVMIPVLLEALKRSVAEDKQNSVSTAFEALEQMIDADRPFLSGHVQPLSALMLELIVNRKLPMNVRQSASFTMVGLVKQYGSQIHKHKIADAIVQVSMSLICEPFEDVFEASEMTPQKVGVELLDSVLLSGSMPREPIFQTCLKAGMDFIKNQQENVRKGGYVVFAVMAEGCATLLHPRLTEILPIVCNGIKDGSPLVRTAACIALSQLADHVEDISDHHKAVLPALLIALNNPQEVLSVRKRLCLALDVFCENLGEEILEYLQPLMKAVFQLMQVKDRQTLGSVFSAIKSIATAAGPAFTPFYDEVIKAIGNTMTLKADKALDLRCRATETAGAVAVAVGFQHIAKNGVLTQLVKLAFEGMELEYFELRDSTYLFFENLSGIMGREFVQILPNVMTWLLATLNSDDGVSFTSANQDLHGRTIIENSDSEEEGDQEGQDQFLIERNVNFSIRSGALDEKVSAMKTLTSLMENQNAAMLAFMPKILEALDSLLEYPHYWVRMSVMECYHEIFLLMYRTFPNPKQWSRGVAIPLHQNTKQVLDMILPNVIDRIEDDHYHDTVCKAIDALTDCLKLFGLGCIEKHMKDLLSSVSAVLNEKAKCQKRLEEENEKTATEQEIEIVDSITDLIGQIAQVAGPGFETVWREFCPLVLKFTEAKRPASNRAMAIGCVGEVSAELGVAVKNYVDKLWPTVARLLADPEILVRRNTSFCLGVLVEMGAEATLPFYEKAVQLLVPLWEIPAKHKADSDWIAARDNACSAICKMILANSKVCPVDKLVPLILRACPIEADTNEAKPVYSCLVGLFRTHPQLMGPHTPAVASVFARVFGNRLIPIDVRTHLLNFCGALMQQCGPQLQAVMNSWPASQREDFVKYVSKKEALPETPTLTPQQQIMQQMAEKKSSSANTNPTPPSPQQQGPNSAASPK